MSPLSAVCAGHGDTPDTHFSNSCHAHSQTRVVACQSDRYYSVAFTDQKAFSACLAKVPPLSHHCPTIVPPLSHHCPTTVPPLSHLCPTIVPPLSHQMVVQMMCSHYGKDAEIKRLSHHCPTIVPPLSHHCPTNVQPLSFHLRVGEMHHQCHTCPTKWWCKRSVITMKTHTSASESEMVGRMRCKHHDCNIFHERSTNF
jgi:hypothetical protein